MDSFDTDSDTETHPPLSVELKVGKRVKTPMGFGEIRGFRSREESIGFGKKRTFSSVLVRLDDLKRVLPFTADKIAVVNDGGA